MSTTDEQIVRLTVNKLAYLLVSIILVTNTVSLTVQRVSLNAEKTEYLDKATKRRIANAVTEQDYKRVIDNLKQDLKEMEEDVIEWQLKYNELKDD